MKLHSIKISIFFVLLSSALTGSTISKAFEALGIHDYFKARKLFYSLNKKQYNSQACYGLAVIFNRNNNPFYNTDSACKYIHISLNRLDEGSPNLQLAGFTANRQNIQQLLDTISFKQLKMCLLENSIKVYDDFLAKNYLTSTKYRMAAIANRDELEYNHIREINKSDSTQLFLIEHPLSVFKDEAYKLMERQIFEEITQNGKEQSYLYFIEHHQKNSNLNNAYDALLEVYKTTKNKTGIAAFIKNYPKAIHRSEAWQLLFTISVKTFTKEELENFITAYPDFPFRNSILKEVQLNDLVLIPIEKNERIGFADTTGKILIEPLYDEVSDFREGLSIVHKNDSVFFINKENVNTLQRIFTDALPFHNGLAPVKVNERWFLIDRSGEIRSEAFDEVNELSEDLYIVKQANFYCAIDEYAQKIYPCKFDKLGYLKNSCAYYQLEGKYGFITRSGYVHKPEFEWISDFSSTGLAIYKLNNKFGLIRNNGKILLDPKYDLIQVCTDNIYLLVLNNSYGFYSSNACFLSEVIYDYEKERSIKFYTNGSVLKLLKKKSEALMDLNGRISIDFNTYQEIGFASNGLIRIKKNNKYGFVDRKLNQVIPFKYITATDFEDSLAIVSTKKGFSIINTNGEVIESSVTKIEKPAKGLFLIETEEGNQLVNKKGNRLFSNLSSFELNGKYLIIYLNNGEIKIVRT
ncbi:MAG: WG repeat-containing protein [Bacteroidia bacterium]|nr:WG repeat-containing protein [Bacteroidia bacterium]